MKGKSTFTKEAAHLIEALIEQKLKANSEKQKGIRDKIRKLGFYASDFRVGNGYTIADFRKFVSVDGKAQTASVSNQLVDLPNTKKAKPNRAKAQSDETYIIDLCDEVLKITAMRQHRFKFLKGDTGVKLPVDAYYPKLKLVIEYHERQHTEKITFFDKRVTSSGIGRGQQRKLYDERRKIEIPKYGLDLIFFDYSEFAHTSSKRMSRNKPLDLIIISQKLKKY